MKGKKFLWSFLTVIMLLSMTVGSALAEDGLLFRRNISKTPESETEKAAIYMMDFYVPAQKSTGDPAIISNYILADGSASEYGDRTYAKPLVSVYIDDLHPVEETKGGISFGHFDAFVGVSLDDGTTWKTTNLSQSSDLSSFNLQTGYAYPGDVHNVVHQVFNDNIFVAWVSKYCEGGSPLYSLTTENQETNYTDYLIDLEETYGKDAVYLYDLFGISGSQGSVDYEKLGFSDVGEIPYSCVWTARGKLLASDDPSTIDVAESIQIMWAKPERLTSGVRDANLPAVDCAAGAGCILTWQEDPEGLRPGLGLGPGEGWSGAVANQQTDIWYSHISQEDFDLVFTDQAGIVIGATPMADYTLETMPKSYVPMAAPIRLTDNAMCKAINTLKNPSDPYCYIDFEDIDDLDPTALPEAPTADSTFCAEQIEWTNPGGTTLNLCVTEDNRLLNGRVASTRVRLNLKPYDTDANGVNDSAWVVMAAEETKALGDTAEDEESDPIDIGKEMWYYTFDPFQDHFMVNQGGMINQPAVCKDDADDFCTGGEGEFYDIQLDDRGFEYYLTEISRRFALTTNSVSAAVNSESGLSAMLIFKQGIINQGGPADIMLRRTLIPDDFDPAVDNPYAFENMECENWVDTDGENPNYLQGVCLDPAINISGTTIYRCDAGSDNDSCADAFPIADDGSNPTGATMPKVFEWRQCQPLAGTDVCVDTNDDNDLDDQTWENPYDVAKGHRGFLDGDIVMMMYAWSPNWNANSVGNDHYNLYVRRSFDGGLTWTTTPAVLGGEGTEYLEYYYGATVGTPVEYPWTYGAGDPEQGRNVSLLTGNKVTILDPRYSPTGGMKLYPTIRTDWLVDNGFPFTDLPYEDDAVRDRSKFFIVYETGDNTTVAEGEAVPLDLYYSRATIYGDVYETMDYETADDDLLLDRWPWLENKADILSGEASMLANPGGTFMYSVWNQWEEEITHYVDEFGIEHEEELVFNSDILFRRLLYSTDDAIASSDYYPVATLLSPTQEIFTTDGDEVITLYLSARDLDALGGDGLLGDGIDEVQWLINGQPFTYTDADTDCNKNKQCKTPAKVLSDMWDGAGWSKKDGNYMYGWFEFEAQAKDNEGHWTKILKTKKYIAANLADLKAYGAYLPMMSK